MPSWRLSVALALCVFAQAGTAAELPAEVDQRLLAARVLALTQAGTATEPPADFDAKFLAARALALAGERDAAIAAYSDLLASSPGNADVLLGRGRVYAWMGCWPDAELDLRAATDAAPEYADAWSALGDLYLWSDRPALAAEAYGHWIALANVSDPAPLIARGQAWRSAGNLVAARVDFEAAGARGADPERVLDLMVSTLPPAPRRITETLVQSPGGYPWSASLGVDRATFSSAGIAFTDTTASVRRYVARGSLGAEVLTASRFGIHDKAFALDAYSDVWTRAYVNLRLQVSPDAALFPHARWRAELFQGVAQGWELSASYDRLGYSPAVELLGVGVGRYHRNWYVRWRHLYIPATPGTGTSSSDRVVARYYYRGDADNYVEMAANVGRNDLPTSLSAVQLQPSHSWSGSTAIVRYLTPRVGIKLGINFGYGLEGEPYSNRGVFATLYTRW